MGITLKRSLHIDPEDIPLLADKDKKNLLHFKMILRTEKDEDGTAEMEKAFCWLNDTCDNHYMVRGPIDDSDSIKYFIYFVDEQEATQFKLTFPQT